LLLELAVSVDWQWLLLELLEPAVSCLLLKLAVSYLLLALAVSVDWQWLLLELAVLVD
jgi:hypothetical protein